MSNDYWTWVKNHDDQEPIEANPDHVRDSPEEIEGNLEETRINTEDKSIMIDMINEAMDKGGITDIEKLILTLVYKDKISIKEIKNHLPYKVSRAQCFILHDKAIKKLKDYLTS